MELLVLGAFHCSGCEFTFDDLEEATDINCETHHNFFHQFLDEYIAAHKTAEEAATHMNELFKSGFNGCVWSTDATHILIEKCPIPLMAK